MTQPTQSDRKHRDKVVSKSDELDFNVTLSSGLRDACGELYQLVREDPAFDAETLLCLKEYADFPLTNLHYMLTALPSIAQQVEQHVARLDDMEARYALNRVIGMLEGGVTKISASTFKSR